jgi:hypothetical protein
MFSVWIIVPREVVERARGSQHLGAGLIVKRSDGCGHYNFAALERSSEQVIEHADALNRLRAVYLHGRSPLWGMIFRT